MMTGHIRVLVPASAAFAVLYTAAKAQFAIEGRLGVHGGPVVTPEDRAQYADTAQIAAAQWANAAGGVLILAVVLLPLLPAARRWPPLVLVVPLAGLGAALVLFGVLMLAGGFGSGGGHLFGLYCTLWGASTLLLALAFRAARRAGGRGAPAAGGGEGRR